VTFDIHQLDTFLLMGSAVTLLAILGVRLSSRSGLPTLLVYLLLGVLLGEGGLGIVFDNAELAHSLGFLALVLILAEGGLTTSWSEVRPSMRLGASLATIGVAVSILTVAVACHFLLGLPWQIAVLLGAVTSPTDAAAVFSVLRVVPLPRRLTGPLEVESGLNDAPTVVVVTLISTGAGAGHGILAGAGIIVYELAGGVLMGLFVGFGGAWAMRRIALPSSGLYPVAVLCLTMVGYGGAASLHASGFAAVFVAGLVLGNSELPHRVATRSFAEGVAWLAQIGLFVMLGLLLSPGRITLHTVALALIAGLVLTFVARPLSVFISALVSPLPWRDLTFLSWAGLRGAVPIVLTTIPLAEGVDGSGRLFDLVFVMVVIYTLLTGPTLPLVARWLKVVRRSEPRGLDVEAAPLDRVAADLLQVTISPVSKMHGVEVGELRLPVGSSVSLIIREGAILVPERRTVLRHGDDLLVVTPRRLREQTEQRLRAVSAGGRLAKWLGPGQTRSGQARPGQARPGQLGSGKKDRR
jgi:cell volume regulation protein A